MILNIIKVEFFSWNSRGIVYIFISVIKQFKYHKSAIDNVRKALELDKKKLVAIMLDTKVISTYIAIDYILDIGTRN